MARRGIRWACAARPMSARTHCDRRSSRVRRNVRGGQVRFPEAPDDTSACGVPDWADFTKSVRGKVEAKRAVQRARSGRPAEELPWYDQKVSTT
eukprot:15478584-Alexandrium_andersonii.AAC.1